MKVKLLIISETMGGGVRKHIADLIQELNKEIYDVVLLYGAERADQLFFEKRQKLERIATLIECRHLKREINLITDFQAYQEICQVIEQVKPDIVHVHSSKAGILGRLAARKKHISKVYYTPHAYAFLSSEFSHTKKQAFIVIERIFSRYFTTMTFNVSEGEKEAALGNQIGKPSQFKVIYNGLAKTSCQSKVALRKRIEVPEECFLVGSNSRFDEQKDPMTAIKIAREVIAQTENVHFAFAGEGALLRNCQTYVLDNHLEQRIHFLGFRSDSEEIVSAYDVFLTSSLYEGLPYSLIEALRVDVPIIATNTTGNFEIVKGGINGELYEIGNVQDGVEKIITFIEQYHETNYQPEVDFDRRFSLNQMIGSIDSYYLSTENGK